MIVRPCDRVITRLSDKIPVCRLRFAPDTGSMIKDKEIYPRFEFRLSHRDREWLVGELAALRAKFNEPGYPAVAQGDLILAALRQGFRTLRGARRLGVRRKKPQGRSTPGPLARATSGGGKNKT